MSETPEQPAYLHDSATLTLEGENAQLQAEVARLTADVAFRKQQIAELIDQRDAALMKLSTAQEEAGAFRRQRDDLVRLLDREVMPRYREMYEAAGLGDFSLSVARAAVYVALLPYREVWDGTVKEGATP